MPLLINSKNVDINLIPVFKDFQDAAVAAENLKYNFSEYDLYRQTLARTEDLKRNFDEIASPVIKLLSNLPIACPVHEKQIDPARLKKSEFYLAQGPIDHDAVMIEQREVGFSDKQKIGTNNIKQCVALILYNPITHKTALAHIDRVTTPDSIVDVIKQFSDSEVIEAYLLGAQLQYGGDFCSTSNLHKTLYAMQASERNINIKSASVLDINAPIAVVFNPEDGTLVPAVPEYEHASMAIRHIRMNYASQGEGTALRVACNFTNGDGAILQCDIIKLLQEINRPSMSADKLSYLDALASALPSSELNDSAAQVQCFNAQKVDTLGEVTAAAGE